MKVMKFVMGLMPLMASLVMAQDMRWESMDGPYYVYDVTGISIGYRGDNLVAYMTGADSNNQYIYCAAGQAPISDWYNKWSIHNIKCISACRNYPLRVYAIKPSNNKFNSYIFNSIDGGLHWIVLPPFRSDNTRFTCIQAHPKNVNICYVGAALNGEYPTSWVSSDGGYNWAEIGAPLATPDGVSRIYVEPDGDNRIENTIIYVCYDNEGIWKGNEGGCGDWEKLNIPNNEKAIDLAVECNLNNNLYVIATLNSRFHLWNVVNAGGLWEYIRDLGANRPIRLEAAKIENHEYIWALAPDSIYFCKSDSSARNWLSFPARDNDILTCMSMDYKNANQAYIGSKYNIEWISIEEKEIIRRTIAKGTNYNGPIKEEWK